MSEISEAYSVFADLAKLANARTTTHHIQGFDVTLWEEYYSSKRVSGIIVYNPVPGRRVSMTVGDGTWVVHDGVLAVVSGITGHCYDTCETMGVRALRRLFELYEGK